MPKNLKNTIRLSNLSRLFLLSLLSLLLLQGYYLWRQNLIVQELSLQAIQRDEFVQALRKNAQKIEQERADQQRRVEYLDSRLQEIMARVEGQEGILSSLSGLTREQGQWLEAEGLLRLAQRQSTVFFEAGSALKLLRKASRIIDRLDDPRLPKLRGLISGEELLLHNDASIDIDGLYFELSDIKTEIDRLPLFGGEVFIEAGFPDPSGVDSQDESIVDSLDYKPGWPQRLSDTLFDIWMEVRALIVIERQPSDRSVSFPQYNPHIKSRLQVLIGQAQLALLQRNEEIYRDNLEGAEEWLEKYFLIRQKAGREIISRVSVLSRAEIVPASDLSRALSLLENIVDTRYRAADTFVGEKKIMLEGGRNLAGITIVKQVEIEAVDPVLKIGPDNVRKASK